jgi:uncharacterized protein with HEPN domain
LEAVQRVLEYTAAGPEAFRQDLRTQDAVIRNLQVIGEATKNVSAQMRGEHPGPRRERNRRRALPCDVGEAIERTEAS